MKAIKPKYSDNQDPKTRVPTHTVVEEPLWDSYLAAVKAELDEPFDEVAEIEDAPEVHFDGGGIVKVNEPIVSVTIDGCTFTCYARQVEFLAPGLRMVKEPKGLLGERVSTNGRWWQFVLTKETAAKIADAFEKQAKKRAKEIDEVWGDIGDAARSPKVSAPTREQVQERHKAAYRRAKFKDN